MLLVQCTLKYPPKVHQISYERLCEEKGFTGGASAIRRAVRELREKQPKAFVSLSFDPGEAIQVDWGQATIILNGVKTQAHIFCMRLCHSIAPFVIAYPTEREESFLEALIIYIEMRLINWITIKEGGD